MKNHKWLFTPWFSSNSQHYENLLEKMAFFGWIPTNTILGFMFTRFSKQDPAKIRYCIDFHYKRDADYNTLMTDDGWHLFKSRNGWFLWEKSYETTRPSIFTDKQSLIDMNNRVLIFVGFILTTQIPIYLIYAKKLFNQISLVWNILTFAYLFCISLVIILGTIILFENAKLRKDLIKK
ncbi:MAG: DUF2812 domain-containing protein [Candidatus Izemoplasmatales bacterium]|nr:DUF2812 domain-containing protein [Candidatus Izemoplasmatales bacterium]